MNRAPALGVIAGGGELPARLAAHARASGRSVFILGVGGFVDPALVMEHGGEAISIGEIGRQIDILKAAGCEEIVFAGLVRRPDLSKLKFDTRGALLLPKLAAAALKGDDALMRVIIGAFEEAGFQVIGADDVLGALLAPSGVLGVIAPTESHWRDIRLAAEAAAAIGALDAGQGAVVCDGLILALEAQEGTDLMLERVSQLPANIRGEAAARRGVLVKRPKPGQERRIDLPTVGIATIENAARAGLAGVAVAAQSSLVLDRDVVVAAADRLGLFLVGFTGEDMT